MIEKYIGYHAINCDMCCIIFLYVAHDVMDFTFVVMKINLHEGEVLSQTPIESVDLKFVFAFNLVFYSIENFSGDPIGSCS